MCVTDEQSLTFDRYMIPEDDLELGQLIIKITSFYYHCYYHAHKQPRFGSDSISDMFHQGNRSQFNLLIIKSEAKSPTNRK